jgi:hypothetical protein
VIVQDLIQRGDHLFDKKIDILNLWQTIAENFYPERADFTICRNLGEEFCQDLMTSTPVIMCRDLGDSFQPMLRPSGEEWFEMTVDDDLLDQRAKMWLERSTKIQRRAMYDRSSLFTRTMKQADRDFAAFGQAVVSIQLNRARDALLYRCWHLRDCAWCEGAEGMIDEMHRKWMPTIRDLMTLFPGKVHRTLVERAEKEPYCQIECRHIVMPGSYRKGFERFDFVSIFIDKANNHILQEIGMNYFMYVVPRWQTVSGSQYAYSPAVVAGLPDARLLQSMTMVLLEAGEKATNPPMIGQADIIRGDMQLYAGGTTWADSEYDERLGAALRPIPLDFRGIPMGMEMRDRVTMELREAFYLDKLTLPPIGKMTATEATIRAQEYIRQAGPLFEPMEQESSAAVCESTFDLLFENKAFGPREQIPRSLAGANVQFKFESPLSQSTKAKKVGKYRQAIELTMESAQLDPNIMSNLNMNEAFRDALDGAGVPAKWIVPEKQAEEARQDEADAQDTEQAIAGVQQASVAAQDAAQAQAMLQEVA